MRDVIQKIVATEGEAKLIVERARGEAERISSEAQRKGQDMLDRARQEAVAEARKIVDAAIEAANREKQELLARAAVEIEREIQLDPAMSERAVEEVVRCVCRQL